MNQSNSQNRSRSKSRPLVDAEPTDQPESQEQSEIPPQVTPSVDKPKQCFRHPFWNFLRDFREELKLKGGKILSKEVAKQAGQRWRTMTLDERAPYVQEAAATRMADGNRVIRRKPYRTANNGRKCPGCGTNRRNRNIRKRSYSTISTGSSATTSFSQSDSSGDDTGDDCDSGETTTVTSISSESSESCESSS